MISYYSVRKNYSHAFRGMAIVVLHTQFFPFKCQTFATQWILPFAEMIIEWDVQELVIVRWVLSQEPSTLFPLQMSFQIPSSH